MAATSVYAVREEKDPPLIYYATQRLAEEFAVSRSSTDPTITVSVEKVTLASVSAANIANMLSGVGGWSSAVKVMSRFKAGKKIA